MTETNDSKEILGFRTFTGHLVDLEVGPTPEQVNIEDIAHHLAFQNRFGGAANKTYSIAEHCMYVSMLSPSKMFSAYYLLHDAAEAWYQDLTFPLKQLIRNATSVYDEKSAQCDKVVFEKLGLNYAKYLNLYKEIKEVDLFVFSLEKKKLFGNGFSLGLPTSHPLYKAPFGVPPEEAEASFLEIFKTLMS